MLKINRVSDNTASENRQQQIPRSIQIGRNVPHINVLQLLKTINPIYGATLGSPVYPVMAIKYCHGSI